jgi:hypothetical protein
MPKWHESLTKLAVSKEALEVVLPPRDLDEMPRRVVTVTAAAGEGKLDLADADIQLGPTDAGPWFDEDIAASGIPTLGPGDSGVYRMDRADRWLRVIAKGVDSEGQTDLTICLDAFGA